MDAVTPADPPTARKTQPRQKRAHATLAKVLAAVEAIVAAEGPDAVTTTRVASESRVAVGTIYRYFVDRDAMLLAAYDATVVRIVTTCHDALETLPPEAGMVSAARRLLEVYLAAAEAIPSHAGLLAAMRRLRPIENDRPKDDDRIMADLIAPFMKRFAPGRADPLLMDLVGTMLSTLVDFYLVNQQLGRERLRAEIEAYVIFMVGRLGGEDADRLS